MPKYMLLLYADEPDTNEREERDAELPAWRQFTDSLREAGLLLGSDRLHPVDSATTVRVRNGETEVLDGPFAVTKEYLGGYYLLECADLDEALAQAARVPLARYGSVEVRPVAEIALSVAADDEAEAAP
jgi:hypothetical protein